MSKENRFRGEKKRRIPVERKLLNRNYYYIGQQQGMTDQLRIHKKVSQYIGGITDNCLVEANLSKRSINEFGNSQLVYSLSG